MSSNVRVNSTIKLNEAKIKELTRQQYESLAQTADALLTDLQDRMIVHSLRIAGKHRAE